MFVSKKIWYILYVGREIRNLDVSVKTLKLSFNLEIIGKLIQNIKQTSF